MAWLRKMFAKYEELIIYVIFGAMATAVDWLVGSVMYKFLPWPDFLASWSGSLSKGTAWFVAMLFAFFTNKSFVFKSNDWSAAVVWPEFIKFAGCRIGTGLLDIATIMLTVDILGWNYYIMVISSSVIVALINYFTTKFLFKKNKTDDCL